MHRSQRRFSRTEVEIVTDISTINAYVSTRDQGSFLVLGGGGGLIEADAQYPIGCLLVFRFRLPDDSEEICCQGVVCSEVEGCGVGVEFLGIRPQDRNRITTFVTRQMTEA